MARRTHLTFAVLGLIAATPVWAQESRTLTADDYARAERMLSRSVGPALTGVAGRITWISADRFWYGRSGQDGTEYFMVQADSRERSPVFDPADLAAKLGALADTAVSQRSIALTRVGPGSSGDTLALQVGRRRFLCIVPSGDCSEESRSTLPPNSVRSPDGKRAAFVKEYNLWVREIETGEEIQLTTDGAEDFGYATNNAGWTRSNRPVLLWSPDSRRIATFQHDGRGVGMMYLVNTAVGHPELEAWKYPLPGDSAIFMIHRVIVDVDQRRLVRLQMPADAHRSTLCDHVVCGGVFADVEWYADGSHLAFVSTTRDHKQATLRVADATTGDVRDVLEERVATQFESGQGRVSWRVLPSTNEVIWFSERDDWGNLYLYDLTSGTLKHQITHGPGPVLQLLNVDEGGRTLTFLAGGKEADRDPYFHHLYRIGFDGRNQRLLTPEDAHHQVTLSPTGKYFVDTWSTPVTPPTTVLRDSNGRLRLALENSTTDGLRAIGWVPPIPFTTKARDGSTDLYGLMFRPTAFDSTKRYPVVNYVYPGPQTGSVGSRAFAAARSDHQALAELGFIVVAVDAMGTPGRSKSFHDAYYGNMGDNGLPDQIATVRQLGERYPWMDLDRVGIWGHSGGGYAAADGILRYPDFYKVAVSQAGNHDNRTYEDDWGERYHGLLTTDADGGTNYDDQANQLLAKNLKGKLLIAHGTMDSNVPPNNTMMLVDALIAANKDFDLVLMTNRRHGFGSEPYMQRRRWDYFVRHLLGAEPPEGYQIGARRSLVP